jgi:hypothetical protein
LVHHVSVTVKIILKMAIAAPVGTQNIANYMGYNLWGSVWNPASDRRWSYFFLTANKSAPYKATDLIGVTRSFTTDVTSLSWSSGEIGVQKIINVTSNCAWAYSGGFSIFQVFGVTASISLGSLTYGGNAVMRFIRISGSVGTEQVFIVYSNGAGGQQSYTTINLIAN